MMTEREIRVRFAPSPTGQLHIGSVRTALFNYLFVKSGGGKMVLRIEDTDEQRSTEESLRTIIDGLRWLGIDWDEGPEKGGIAESYYQSERVEIHREYAQKLIDAGKTYYCDCTGDEGPTTCNCKNKDQEALKNSPNSVVRFNIPDGITEIDDLIRGKVKFNNLDIKDFVILKSNGNPVYNFAVVVDDITMGITHVIRGDDHLSNTPKQILLYKALGVEPPIMAHLPLILSPLGGKLSKRQIAKPQNTPDSQNYVPAVNVEWYCENGFLPEAFVNYLARLCWSNGTDEEFFTLDELIEKFSMKGVSPTAALYDWKKLKWYNANYIRNLSVERFIDECMPFFIKAHGKEAVDEKGEEWCSKLLPLYQERVEYFAEIGDKTKFYFERPVEFTPKDIKKVKWNDETRDLLKEFLLDICAKSDFTVENLESTINQFTEQKEIKLGRIMQPIRLAVSGTRATPGLYDVLNLIGKEETIERVKWFIDNVDVI